MKKTTLTLLAAGWAWGASALLALAAPTAPNILFIMSDDHAAHAISAYGSKINQTPHIDRLAREGMRFNHCFAVNSICTPSRASILTGKYSHKNAVPVFNPMPRQWTVAQELQKNGYHTGMVGKWHLTTDPQGFDYWYIVPGQGLYHNPLFYGAQGTNRHQGYVTDLTTDFCLQFLEKRPKDKPFFLMCHQKAPHRPWQPDEKHRKMFENADFPEPPTFHDTYAGKASAAAEAEMRVDRDLNKTDLKMDPPPGLAGADLKRWKYRRYLQDYLACVASVDDNVGRLLDYLDKAGLATNTVVIYTSDQGFFLGDHNWYDKRFMYEESIKMPFLVRYPAKIKPGTTADPMILNVDFAATFIDLAGLPPHEKTQGRSFCPLLEGRTPKDWRTSFYYRYYHYPQDHRVQPHYGVRTDRYKLICFDTNSYPPVTSHRLSCQDTNHAEGEDCDDPSHQSCGPSQAELAKRFTGLNPNRHLEWELYDLKNDPREMTNVFRSAAYAQVRQMMTNELDRVRQEVDDRNQYAYIKSRPSPPRQFQQQMTIPAPKP